MVANKRYSNSEIFGFFLSKIVDMNPESRMRYRKTLNELDVFLTSHALSLINLTQTIVADWVIDMLSRGMAKGTIVNHLNHLSSLWNQGVKKGILQPNDAPRAISKKLSDRSMSLPLLINSAAYAGCLALIRGMFRHAENSNIYEDIVLLSMLNGVVPVEEIAMLKDTDASEYAGLSRTIIERNMNKKRRYVFDLRQSYLTPKQMKSSLNAGIQSLFGKYIGGESFDADEFIRSLWVAIAIRSGISASDALAYAGGSASYSVMPFNHPSDAAPDGKKLWVNTVNAILLHDMPRWYAMHLRKGVKYDEMRKDVYEKIHPVPEFFYPCETFVKQIRNKKIIDEQPYISSTVFFKAFPEKVQPLFNAIGEKAWCYRTLGVPGSPYAVIPQSDMERFQKAIGVFTPDTEIKPLGELAPKPGESVIIVSAGFGGLKGKVEEVINKDSGSVIFRVKLSTDNGYEFRIDLDERQIEKEV